MGVVVVVGVGREFKLMNLESVNSSLRNILGLYWQHRLSITTKDNSIHY